MPFSTYLRDAAPTDVHETQQHQHVDNTSRPSQYPQQDQQYPGYGVYPSPGALRQYGSYYPRPAATSPPNSNGLVDPSSCSSSGKPYSVPSPVPAMRDGLFQMPSFLMGNFGGTLAPGGGAEVLSPNTLGMFDFVSSPYALPPSASAPAKPSWQTTKYYTLDGMNDGAAPGTATTNTNAAKVAAAAPISAPAQTPPAASPFGYLNAESPREQQALNVQEMVAADDDDGGETAAGPSKDDRPSSAMHARADLYAPVPTSGLPVYSQSGFDMLSILARVARRSNQTISLGPVDLTCAFVVSDVRRTDAPIVYASRTFSELTGYSESEILGRNCRFLQAPGGRVARSDIRRFTSPDAVRDLRFALDKDREVQVSLINYRKDGCPFVNRLSIVPIPAEDDGSEIAFHVGFQVDLNEQPGLIAQRIQDGKFYSGGAFGDSLFKTQTPAERSARGMGKRLRTILSDPSFQSSVPLAISCNAVPSSVAAAAAAAASVSMSKPDASNPNALSGVKPDARDERQWLNLVLIEHMPDFIHVLSLKGHFLYVSPGITRVLGYEPSDLIGKSVGDFCHPSDAVPLLRELKESTGQVVAPGETSSGANGGGGGGTVATLPDRPNEAQTGQRSVDLLFRMRTKAGTYAWIESIGRLHVEAGKGRKAIVLSGRMCVVPNLRWGAISQAGGILGPQPLADCAESDVGEVTARSLSVEREFWAMMCEDGLFLVVGMGVRDLLGWGTGEMIGRSIRDFIIDDGGDTIGIGNDPASVDQVLTALGRSYSGEQGTQSLTCQMKKRDGEVVWIQLTLYANDTPTPIHSRVIVQFKLLSSSTSSSPAQDYQAYSPTNFMNTAYPFSFTTPSQTQQSPTPYSYTMSSDAPRTAGRILHAPSTNVFAEFETHRGTSWQYELQQLKFANDKLREEVDMLEARQRQRHQMQQQQHHAPPWVGSLQA